MPKRPQSPSGHSSKKVKGSAHQVAIALETAKCWPNAVGQGLASMVMASLTTNKADRIGLQGGFVDVIEKALDEIRAGLQATVDEHQKALDQSSEERDRLQSALDTATTASTSAKEALAALSTKNHENKENLQATKKTVAETRDQAKRTEAEVATELKEHTDMEQGNTETFVASKDAAATKGAVRSFMNLCKRHGIDDQLLDYWHDLAIQEPGARGGFGDLVHNELLEAVDAVRARLSQAASGGEAKNAACLAALADAETAFNMATATLEAGKTAVAEAEANVKTTHAALAEAKEAHKKFHHTIAPQTRRLNSAQAELVSFCEEALEAFKSLKDLKEEVEVAPAPVPTAAPAAEAPVAQSPKMSASPKVPQSPLRTVPAVPVMPPSPSINRSAVRSPPPPSPSPSMAR